MIRYDLRIYWMLALLSSMSMELLAQSTHIQSTLHFVGVFYCFIFWLDKLALHPNWVENNSSSYDKELGGSLNT